MAPGGDWTAAQIVDWLQVRGVSPTSQRLAIAAVLLRDWTHLSADEVHSRVNAEGSVASKATVYNTLGLFARKGLVREVIADPNRVFYDPNTAPHHHFYDVTTGALRDIDAQGVQILGLPKVPEGMQVEGIEVIVRVRSSPAGVVR